MNAGEIARVAHAAGFRGRSLETAVAVAMAESGGNPGINARGAEDSRGLWQINSVHFGRYDGRRLYEPAYNARAAYDISERGRNWHPWTTWEDGLHEQYLDDARRAVQARPWRHADGGRGDTGRRRADDGARRRAELAPWRIPPGGAGATGRLVVTPSFLDDLARTLTGHLATADGVDRGARHRVAELGIDELVVTDGFGGFVKRAAKAAVDDHDGTRRLPGLLTRDVGYVVEAHRRAVDMDAAKAFGAKAVDVLVASLGRTTSPRTRNRVRRLLSQLGPDHLPTTPRRSHRPGGAGGTGGTRRAAVRLDRRWGGTQAVFEQLVTPLLRERGLPPGSAKRGVIPGSSTASDHYEGNTTAYAVDYPTPRGADDARAVARRLGVDGWRPDAFQRFPVRIGGARFRVQILWGAAIDHADHLHVGIRRA